MDRIVRHRGARWVSHFLVVALMAPFFASAGSGAAFAQSARLTRQLGVVVLDIEDVSKEVVDDNLARLAKDAVWNEMSLNRWFLPVPPRDVQAEMERSNFVPPLSPREQQELARQLQADITVTGFVRVVRVGGDPRVATVELQLFALDQLSGECINGATVTESSIPKPGFAGPDSTLVQEALKKAAGHAVDIMATYEVPETYVLSVTTAADEETIRIGIGEKDGIEPGQRFVVIGSATNRETDQSFPEKRGIIEVVETRTTISVCKRVEAKRSYTIQSGDFVRGLYYDSPIGKSAAATPLPRGNTESKTKRNLPKILGVVALLVVFGILLNQSGSHTAPRMGVRASGLYLQGVPSALVRVRWNPGGAIPTTPQARAGYIIGYEVHRGVSPEFPVTPNSMQMFLEGGLQTRYDDDATLVPSWWTTDIESAGEDSGLYVVTTLSTDGGPAEWQFDANSISYTYQQQPPVPGQHYYYAIRLISKKLGAQPFPPPEGGTGGGAGDENLEGQLIWGTPVRCGPATAIEPPELEFPPDRPAPGSTDVDLDTVLFQWQSSAGADVYVIELSTDRTFPAGQTIRSREIVQRTLTSGQSMARRFEGTGGQTPKQLFANWSGPIYWRVGARCDLDQYAPITVTGQEIRYIFGRERSFQALELPPSAP